MDGHRGSKHVLLVDDEEDFLVSLRAGLHCLRRELVISTAGNGREAMAVLERGGVDLVLTDVRMPEMDGIALLVHVRDRHPGMPVLVMTAFGGISEEQLRVLGACGILEKPLDCETVEQAIAATLGMAALSIDQP